MKKETIAKIALFLTAVLWGSTFTFGIPIKLVHCLRKHIQVSALLCLFVQLEELRKTRDPWIFFGSATDPLH